MSPSANERQETDAQIQAATGVLLEARDRYAALRGFIDPMTGSMLAAENEATPFDPIAMQITRHRARATDAVELLFESMYDEGEATIHARPFAMYALIRMSIEASALANWTLQSEKKSDRIFRSLQVAYTHLREYALFASTIAAEEKARPYTDFRDDKSKRLIELKDAVGVLRQKELTTLPKYTNILQAVSPTVPPKIPQNIDSPFVVWKMASAFLHGSDHIVTDLGDVRLVSEDESGQTVEITPSLQLLASCALICVQQIERLDDRQRYLATTAYGGRKLL